MMSGYRLTLIVLVLASLSELRGQITGIDTIHLRSGEIVIDSLAGFDDWEKLKLDTVLQLFEFVNDSAFERQIKNSSLWVRTYRYNRQDVHGTIQQAWKIREWGQSVGTVSLELDSILRPFGKAFPEKNHIKINRYFFQCSSPGAIAANLLHEYMHILGFRHSKLPLPFKTLSVPYKMGHLLATHFRETEPGYNWHRNKKKGCGGKPKN